MILRETREGGTDFVRRVPASESDFVDPSNVRGMQVSSLAYAMYAESDVPARVVDRRPLVRKLLEHVFAGIVAICSTRGE